MSSKPFTISDLPERYRAQAETQLGLVRERNKQLLEPPIATAIKRQKRGTEEADLQSEIIEHLQTLGYLTAHFRPAKTEQGWRTPVEGDGEGFPDVIAIHPLKGKCVVLELKSETGRLKEKQLEWLRGFMNVQGVTVMVVRPSNWNDLRALL